MAKQKKTLTRGQQQLLDTEGMTPAEMEPYIMTLDWVTPELAGRYLGYTAQGIRIAIRNESLPIALPDGNISIQPERLIRWRRGTLGVDGPAITKALIEAIRETTGPMAEAAADVIHTAIAKAM